MCVGESMSNTDLNNKSYVEEFELSQGDLDEFFEFADKFVNDLSVLYNNSSEFIIGNKKYE